MLGIDLDPNTKKQLANSRRAIQSINLNATEQTVNISVYHHQCMLDALKKTKRQMTLQGEAGRSMYNPLLYIYDHSCRLSFHHQAMI